jgi:hypothetical protein
MTAIFLEAGKPQRRKTPDNPGENLLLLPLAR